MKTCLAAIALAIGMCAGAGTAAPQIEFDTKTFDCGTVIEGKTGKLKAVFVLGNTGDETLKLISVRPGCGCTVVKYDSIIAPGASMRMESQVDLTGYRSGPFSKSITVTSNASNEPTVRLMIQALIAGIIDVSEPAVMWQGDSVELWLFSKKADLVVKEVDVRPGVAHDNTARTLPLRFVWSPTDSIRSDGARGYRLSIAAPAGASFEYGEVVIRTNHREKPELHLRAHKRTSMR